MKIIKFRGISKETGKWIYGDLIQSDDYFTIVNRTKLAQNQWESIENEVIPESIGQFIGQIDKNEKEIYDGDIVKLLCGEAVRRNNILAKIVWDNERARFIPELLGKNIKIKGGSMNGKIVPDYEIHSWTGMHNCFSSEENMEVIGNIHQNKNLLN